jgi:hypothetical protein
MHAGTPLLWLWLGLALVVAPAASASGDVQSADDEDPFAALDEDWGEPWEEEATGLRWSGFAEAAIGARSATVEPLDRMTLGELRWRAETRYERESIRVDFKGDLAWDEVIEDLDASLRELAAAFRPSAHLDARLGRQVLTWGTGDLLFLNDLFAKDFVSFFAGRDEDYLKSPSDTLRLSLFTSPVNVDFAWTPHFSPDDYLYGERFAFWNPALGEVVAPAEPRRADEPGNGEYAIRLFRTVQATELALYGYHGRWKQPLGTGTDGQPRFPRLSVWGASLRTPLRRGLFNAEAAWYDSREDRDGDKPQVPNSQLRLLAGYEQELVRNLNAGTQIYAERTLDHGALLANSQDPQREPEKWRTVATLRVTHRAWRDTLTSSLFLFVSPSDEDYYLRPSLSWRRDDNWLWSVGGNLFGGRHDHSFFGQLEDNSNAWGRIRYHY